MAEFESSRIINAHAETTFGIAADLDSMEDWLPTTVAIESAGRDQVHMSGDADGHHYEAEGLYRAEPQQLRMEWGSRDTDNYSGWLQVSHSGDDTSCEATMHLSFRADNEPDSNTVSDIDEALERLDRLVQSKA